MKSHDTPIRKPLPQFPLTPEGYRAFATHIISVEGVNLHPEDKFDAYIDKRGEATYTKLEAQTRQRLHDQFEEVLSHEEILTIALEVMLEFYRAGVKPLKFEGAYAV